MSPRPGGERHERAGVHHDGFRDPDTYTARRACLLVRLRHLLRYHELLRAGRWRFVSDDDERAPTSGDPHWRNAFLLILLLAAITLPEQRAMACRPWPEHEHLGDHCGDTNDAGRHVDCGTNTWCWGIAHDTVGSRPLPWPSRLGRPLCRLLRPLTSLARWAAPPAAAVLNDLGVAPRARLGPLRLAPQGFAGDRCAAAARPHDKYRGEGCGAEAAHGDQHDVCHEAVDYLGVSKTVRPAIDAPERVAASPSCRGPSRFARRPRATSGGCSIGARAPWHLRQPPRHRSAPA